MKTILIVISLFLYQIPLQSQQVLIPDERWKVIEEFLRQQKDFSGIVMIGSGTQIKLNKGFGYADRSKKIPYSDQTLFTIGSITKPFTATAIMLLMEEGKLNPGDKITRYLLNVPDDKSGITIHHLLTHSSGLPGAIGDDYEAISTEDFQKLVWQQPLLFKPGEGYEYSNVGYSLLGMIVEKISGETYNDFLQENIFSKAGMKTAGYTNPDADYANLAHGYSQDGSDWGTSKNKLWNGNEPFWHLKANGGLLMSATDIYQWYLALRDHKVLKPETMKIQLTPYVDEGQGSFYGYGFAIEGECVQHNGENRIFKADFRWFRDSDLFFFSATNDANVRLFRLNDEIIRILMTGELPEQDDWKPVSINELPNDPRHEATKAFLEIMQQYSIVKAEAFIDHFCTKGILERNGRDKLLDILKMLADDSNQHEVDAMYQSGKKLKFVFPAREENARLKITLLFDNHQVERLSAEIEGM